VVPTFNANAFRSAFLGNDRKNLSNGVILFTNLSLQSFHLASQQNNTQGVSIRFGLHENERGFGLARFALK
jgi:hypothetical protein